MLDLFNYRAKVLNVVDGDTVDLEVDVGFDWHFNGRFRLFGINAPERYAIGGREATAHLLSLIPIGSPVLLDSMKDKRDKYGRYLATILADGIDVNMKMVQDGHAVLASY